MSVDTLFRLANFGPLAFWLLLVVAPRSRWTDRLVHSGFAVALLSLAHLAGFLSVPIPEGATGAHLAGAMRLFDTPEMFLVCWVHFVAFDLFVGAWIARDARRLGIHHGFVVPILVVANQLGPTGLVPYLVLRGVLRGAWTFDERRDDAHVPSLGVAP